MADGSSYTCPCCGRTVTLTPVLSTQMGFGVFPDPIPEDIMCGFCWVRGGLCLHNAGKHPGRSHSSRVHPYPNPYADRPEDCPPCVQARKNAEWVRTVPELQREPGIGINWR